MAKPTNATLYRDPEYGALGVIPTAEGILTVDHGFAPRDFEAVLDVLERNAREDVQGDGASLWRVVGHPLAVLGSIESALRARGYAEDALAERAIIAVPAEAAHTPDLPSEARAAGYRPSEAIERALRKHIDAALVGLKTESVDVRWFPRPAAPDRHGRPLPFVRVRALVSRSGAADVCRGMVREGLAFGSGVVRVSAVEAKPGRVAIEFALAPSREVAEAFLAADLPTFAPAKEGVREAVFLLDAPLPDLDRLAVEGRALACNAALRVEAVDARTLCAIVPAGFMGEHLYDHAFSARVGWLSKALGPSAALESVGAVLAEALAFRVNQRVAWLTDNPAVFFPGVVVKVNRPGTRSLGDTIYDVKLDNPVHGVSIASAPADDLKALPNESRISALAEETLEQARERAAKAAVSQNKRQRIWLAPDGGYRVRPYGETVNPLWEPVEYYPAV